MSDFRDAGIETERAVEQIQSLIYSQALNRGTRASIEVRNTVLDVLEGQRSGKRYRNPATNQMYTASAPGEAPAARTGLFRISFKESPYITERNGNLIIHARVVSKRKAGNHLLGDILENGTEKIKPRPYKNRVIQLALPKVLQIFKEPYVR